MKTAAVSPSSADAPDADPRSPTARSNGAVSVRHARSHSSRAVGSTTVDGGAAGPGPAVARRLQITTSVDWTGGSSVSPESSDKAHRTSKATSPKIPAAGQADVASPTAGGAVAATAAAAQTAAYKPPDSPSSSTQQQVPQHTRIPRSPVVSTSSKHQAGATPTPRQNAAAAKSTIMSSPQRLCTSSPQAATPCTSPPSRSSPAAISHKERRRLEIYAMNAILAAHEEAQARAALSKLQSRTAGGLVAEAGSGAATAAGSQEQPVASSAVAHAAVRIHGV